MCYYVEACCRVKIFLSDLEKSIIQPSTKLTNEMFSSQRTVLLTVDCDDDDDYQSVHYCMYCLIVGTVPDSKILTGDDCESHKNKSDKFSVPQK